MVSQWFVVGTQSVVFLQQRKNHDNLERGTLQRLHTEEISTSDITKLWWGMKARGAEGHRLVQKRWERLKKVEVGFWVMKGLNELRWQGAKMTRRAWETSGWFYLKLQDKNMRGNKIRGNIAQALGKNKPGIPVADLTPVSLTNSFTQHLCTLGRFSHELGCTFALWLISSGGKNVWKRMNW